MTAWQKPIRGTQLNKTHPLARGLVGCWIMNEGSGNKIYDLSGNENHGTLVNGPIWVAGRKGQALEFDGVDDIVEPISPDPGVFHDAFTERTVAAWATINSPTTAPVCLYDEGGRANGFALGYRYGIKKVAFVTCQSSICVEAQSTNTYDNTDGFIHIVGVYDKGTMTLYVNGRSGGTDSNGASIPSHANEPGIGGIAGTDDALACAGNWKGIIDEVRIYNRALSAEEIQWLYREPYAMFEPLPSFLRFFPEEAAPPVADYLKQQYYYNMLRAA